MFPALFALTKWLTNSGCVTQALSSLSHTFSVRQTIMSAMSQQLQSDLCVAGTSNPPQTRTGRNPVGLKSIDTNKGSAEATDFFGNTSTGTLPCSVLYVFQVKDPMLITIADVSRAHFHAVVARDVYVRLPSQDPKTKQPQACVGNCERQCMALWMRPNDGESITCKFWRKDSPEPWRLRVTSSTKTWRRTFWYTAMIFCFW